MSSCLQSWILRRLGISVKLDPESAGEQLFDGYVYFKILQSYNYGTDCGKYDRAKDSLSALSKLREMGIWFSIVGVSHDDLLLKKIAFKDGAQALRLLFNLFVALENKDNSNVIYNERAKGALLQASDRYNIAPSRILRERKSAEPIQEVMDPCLQLTPAEHREITEIFRDQEDQILQKNLLECFKRRNLAKTQLSVVVDTDKKLSSVGGKVSKKFDVEKAASTFDIEKAKMQLPTDDGVVECSPEEYLYLLRLWRRKSNANEFRDRKTQTKLLHTLWQHMIKAQTDEFHEAFCNKLLQQSKFEKNLAARLNRIHYNYKVYCENSEAIKNELDNQAAEAFNFKETYKVLHQLDEEAFEEKKRVWQLHRKLYDEKLEKRRREIRNFCRETAYALVEFALKVINFKESNNSMNEVPRKLLLEWKEQFYKGICDGSARAPKEEIVGEGYLGELSEFEESFYGECEESEPYETINVDEECDEYWSNQDVHNYLYLTGPWFYETLLPDGDLREPVLNITGFIVHRLLEAKYPFPPPPPKPDLFEYRHKMILTPFTETILVNKLKQLFNNKSIAVIDMPAATNYCIHMYKKEKNLSKVGATLRDKTEDVKSGKKKKVRKKTESKKKSGKGKTGKGKDKKGTTRKESTAVVEFADKAIQVPSEEDLMKKAFGHSRAGLLGKLAFETLHGGKQLSDIHLIQMFIEYLKSFGEIDGWVLLNYPMSFQQAALLEYILAGNRIYIPRAARALLPPEDGVFDDPFIDPNIYTAFEEKLEELKNLSLKQLAEKRSSKTAFDHDELLGEGEMILEEEFFGEQISEYIPEKAVEEKVVKRTLRELLELRTSKILPRPAHYFEPTSYFTKYFSMVKQRSNAPSKNPYHNQFYPLEYITDPVTFYDSIGMAVRISYRRMDIGVVRNINRTILNEVAGIRAKESDETTISVHDSRSPSDLSTLDSSKSSYTPSISGEETSDDSSLDAASRERLTAPKKKLGPIDANESSITLSAPEISAKEISDTTSVYTPKKKRVHGRMSRPIEIEDTTYLMDLTKHPRPPSFLDRYDQIEEAEEIREEEEYIRPIIYPGDPDWEYSELPIPLGLMKSLASVWETVESTYLDNLKEVFRSYRALDRKVIPYKLFLRKAFDKCINSVDNRQAAVTDFQGMFNSVNLELRTNDDMKAELHCRLLELYNELCEMSDQRKKTAEATRKEIIGQNWVAHQAYAVVNLAICLIQFELDRFIDTLQLYYDYHMASLQKLPPEKRIEKIRLNRMKYPDVRDSAFEADKTKKKKRRKLKVRRIMRIRSRSMVHNAIPSGIEVALLHDELDLEFNPAHPLIVDTAEDAIYLAKNNTQFMDNIIKLEYNYIYQEQLRQQKTEFRGEQLDEENVGDVGERRKTNKTTKGEPDLEDKSKKKKKKWKKEKKKTGKKKKKTSEMTVKTEDTSEKKDKELSELSLLPVEFTSNLLAPPYNNLLWEWSKGVEEETDRLIFRIKLIEARTKNDLDELLQIMSDVFLEFTKETTQRYHQEIKNIYLLMNLFKAAIEESQLVRPLIILDEDDFFVDSGVVLSEDIPPPPPPTPMMEPADEYVFSIEQLTNIMEKLKIAAPDGIIEDSFVTILEDMIVFGRECGYAFLPKGWSHLTNADIRQLIEAMFAESAMIDWKDFLIFGLNIRYPTIKELLSARAQMMLYDPEDNETISWNNFQKVSLWFENEIEEGVQNDLRKVLIKEFLFKLYLVSEREMNYAAMLMAFCRDEDPGDGFAKALSLVSGKPFVVTARELYKAKDVDYYTAAEVAEYILNLLLHTVIDQAEGVVIREVSSTIVVDKYEYFLNELDVKREIEIEAYEADMRWREEEQREKHEMLIESSIWFSLVPYDMMLSIILYYLHFHPLSPDHLYRGMRIADELKELYMDKGRWNVIQAYQLVESELMTNLIYCTGMFRAVCLATMVEKMVNAKDPALAAEVKKNQNPKH